jgi:hypothetical protein
MKRISKFFKKHFQCFFKVSDVELYNALGQHVYIKNGVGSNFLVDPFLYNNAYINLGIGYIRSGLGDWGGGFDHAIDAPLWITLDKNLVIKAVKTKSFYNSEDSQKKEAIAEKYLPMLSVGSEFIIKNPVVQVHIEKIFKLLPCKVNINYDVLSQAHMLKIYEQEAFEKSGVFYNKHIQESNYEIK